MQHVHDQDPSLTSSVAPNSFVKKPCCDGLSHPTDVGIGPHAYHLTHKNQADPEAHHTSIKDKAVGAVTSTRDVVSHVATKAAETVSAPFRHSDADTKTTEKGTSEAQVQ